MTSMIGMSTNELECYEVPNRPLPAWSLIERQRCGLLPLIDLEAARYAPSGPMSKNAPAPLRTAGSSDHIGRPLADHENVHHRNGIRDDNRLENLELWCVPQPCGQRVEDMVDWVIATYPERIASRLTA